MVYLKRAIIFVMLIDNWITQGLKRLFPSNYKISGKCKQCGVCCHEILLKMTSKQMKSDFFRNLCVRWLSWLYDFYLLFEDRERGYLAFSCKHKGKDGKCLNYKWRPPICRNYPLLDYFKKPVFIPGCGFKSRLP